MKEFLLKVVKQHKQRIKLSVKWKQIASKLEAFCFFRWKLLETTNLWIWG